MKALIIDLNLVFQTNILFTSQDALFIFYHNLNIISFDMYCS